MKERRNKSLKREGAAVGDGSDVIEEWEPKDISTSGIG